MKITIEVEDIPTKRGNQSATVKRVIDTEYMPRWLARKAISYWLAWGGEKILEAVKLIEEGE